MKVHVILGITVNLVFDFKDGLEEGSMFFRGLEDKVGDLGLGGEV